MAQHILPPARDINNTPTWTDSTITAGATKHRKVHMDELRSYINGELVRRGFSGYSWTDPTITADVTKVRKIHIDELRAACNSAKTGYGETGYCSEDTSGCIDFTDPTITAGTTNIRKPHIDELRTKVTALMTGCICETEQCQYCADCGYYYSVFWCSCNVNAVGCCNSCSPQGCTHYGYNYYWDCASVNVGGTHPYKSSTSSSSYVLWDGTVPWAWGAASVPPGSNWTAHWSCKCNPFTHA